MKTPAEALRDLEAVAASLTPAERPPFMAAVSAVLVRLSMDLASPPVEREHWITVWEAAEIAGVPRRRVSAWSRRRGIPWASRPSSRTLRIHEGRFREWLESSPTVSKRPQRSM